MDNFKRLIAGFNHNSDIIISKNPKVKSVKLKEDTFELEIEIEMEEPLDKVVEKSLSNYFKEKLSEFKLSVIYVYPAVKKTDPVEALKEQIIKYNPSGKVWIENIEIKNLGSTMEIIVPEYSIYYAMNKNGLKSLVKENLNLELVIKCEEKPIMEEHKKVDLFQTIEDEEKKICQVIEDTNIKLSEDNNIKENKKETKPEAEENSYSYGRKKINNIAKLSELHLANNVTVKVDIFKVEEIDINAKKAIEERKYRLFQLSVTDYSTSIKAKLFVPIKKADEFAVNIKDGVHALITGDIVRDEYSKSNVLMIKYINIQEKEEKLDSAIEKRVELHLHTQMSNMDGVSNIDSYVKQAAKWGHSAIAITDHGTVQGFPEAMNASKKHGIKMIYGMEGYLVNDEEKIIYDYENEYNEGDFVVFDVETTGFSYLKDKITEIGAVKISGGNIVDRFSTLVNPQCEISERITEVTGITNEMVKDQPTIDSVITKFYEFCKGSVLVAHNMEFDKSFIRKNLEDNGMIFDFPNLDTLKLARARVEGIKNYKLGTLAKHFGVTLTNAHRAVNDAEATAEVFMILMEGLKKENVTSFEEINLKFANKEPEKLHGNHISILVKNLEGLKNLYKLVSISNLEYFYRKPKLLKSLILKHRQGLLLGSSCSSGELYDAVKMSKPDREIEEIAKFYDYLEIQPISNNSYLLEDGFAFDEDHLRKYNRKIYNLGKKLNIPVVATGDAHYTHAEEDILRRIILVGQKMKVPKKTQEFYFRSTEEMLKEFSYLGKDEAFEVVVTNTNAIADSIDNIKPVPDGTYPPIIDGADEELKELTYERAYELYGKPLPNIVENRIEKELNSIIKNGYGVLYIIAQKLVKKSNEDGYYVGSRGSVGSSLVATLSGITEVNPLQAHYYCSKCNYSEFPEEFLDSGVDLENKKCPKCKEEMAKEGHNIPFEVFLGFDGDKEPDIDLNFASEYQAHAHKYTEDLFGEGYVFRAGTIGKLADKTAYGYVKKYFEEIGEPVNPAEIDRLVNGLVGVKRTSGQHPGGVMICPKYKEIYDFTPIQYPADDKKSGVITTHFDYKSISGRILKLDILGHDTPTMIKMLEDFTGFESKYIKFDHKETLRLFTSMEPLKADEKIFDYPTGTFGIPEFGTKFVRDMLVETKPKNFSDLVRISGLSHGTDVWINNAQNLVRQGEAKLSDVISTREDIMVYLIAAGAENKMAFDTMEKVRKGKGLRDEECEKMNSLTLPKWYIDSCQKIKYMFPKAHAVAYVMISFRIAYYKLMYPEAFYATYFSMKIDDFNGQLIFQGVSAVEEQLKDLCRYGADLKDKQKSEVVILEVALEMYARGYKFLEADIYKSDPCKFTIEEGGVRMPLRALVGVGETAAYNIAKEREKGEFISIEDLTRRTKSSKTVIEALTIHGCLEGLDKKDQLSFF